MGIINIIYRYFGGMPDTVFHILSLFLRLFNSSPQVTLLSLHFKVNKWPKPIPIRIIQA